MPLRHSLLILADCRVDRGLLVNSQAVDLVRRGFADLQRHQRIDLIDRQGAYGRGRDASDLRRGQACNMRGVKGGEFGYCRLGQAVT